MYNYQSLSKLLNISIHDKEYIILKSIIKALISNNEAYTDKQMIYVDINRVKYLYNILIQLNNYFDYEYNTKIDLVKFVCFIINNDSINMNAIFCPGYTDNGYKNYIGNNNSNKIIKLFYLKKELIDLNINNRIKIILADIFLENIDSIKNKNWMNELEKHKKLFYEFSNKYFNSKDILYLSDIFSDEKYVKGFINKNELDNKVYKNFYKNNLTFYNNMNWNIEKINERIEKLYTIYSEVSEYINSEKNCVYLPMEDMYFRSKVMTNNDVCTMYLKKVKGDNHEL